MIGLVGHSGSGKSTLVNLICRFYDVSEGSIRADGIDSGRLRVADYRRHIGLVPQEPFPFFGTIAENIAYGRPAGRHARADRGAAVRAAHAHEFIPGGRPTATTCWWVSGQSLGRRASASALRVRCRSTEDPGSSTKPPRRWTPSIEKESSARARRPGARPYHDCDRAPVSTLRKADRLVVMDRGEVVEVGTHDDLLELARG